MNVIPIASPFESVSALPTATPSAFFKTTLDPDTAVPSASTAISSARILLNKPLPVTSTLEVSIVPSIKLTDPEPVISTSLVFAKVLSVKLRVPDPAFSTPTKFVAMLIPVHDLSSVVENFREISPDLPRAMYQLLRTSGDLSSAVKNCREVSPDLPRPIDYLSEATGDLTSPVENFPEISVGLS